MSIIQQHIPLVLASSSPVRAQLLKSVGLEFSVVPSNVNEAAVKEQMPSIPPRKLAQRLAREKALSVSANYPDALTIGADQVCTIAPEQRSPNLPAERIMNKPETEEQAKLQLSTLSGKSHRQMSAVCIAKDASVLWEDVATARLTMRPLTQGDIENYIKADQPLQSCGSYKYESLGRHLFSEVKGDTSTIAGLSLTPLLAQLYRQNAISLS